MSELEDVSHPAAGLYEQLITLRFEQQLHELSKLGWYPLREDVGAESVPHVLARHVARTVHRVLQNLPAEERVHAANHILDSISTLKGAQEWVDLIADGPQQLLAITRQEAPGVFAVRPGIPLSDAALLTNAPEDPSPALNCARSLPPRIASTCSALSSNGMGFASSSDPSKLPLSEVCPSASSPRRTSAPPNGERWTDWFATFRPR